MKKYCPLINEIAFARLDKRLSEEDKKSILKVAYYKRKEAIAAQASASAKA